MATSYLKFTSADVASSGSLPTAFADKRKMLRSWVRYLLAIIGGYKNASVATCMAEASGVAASGTYTVSSGSGTLTAIVNGQPIAVTWATSDTNSAALMAAAMNASATAVHAGIISATSALGVVTISATEKSKLGNAITTTATGTGFSAGQARLTGGVALAYTSYNFGA